MAGGFSYIAGSTRLFIQLCLPACNCLSDTTCRFLMEYVMFRWSSVGFTQSPQFNPRLVYSKSPPRAIQSRLCNGDTETGLYSVSFVYTCTACAYVAQTTKIVEPHARQERNQGAQSDRASCMSDGRSSNTFQNCQNLPPTHIQMRYGGIGDGGKRCAAEISENAIMGWTRFGHGAHQTVEQTARDTSANVDACPERATTHV